MFVASFHRLINACATRDRLTRSEINLRGIATRINVAASRSTAARSGSAAKAIPTTTPRVEGEQRRL
jgi:hypothetical protein